MPSIFREVKRILFADTVFVVRGSVFEDYFTFTPQLLALQT